MPGLKRTTLVIERRRMTGNQEQLAYEPLARIEMTPEPHGPGIGFAARYRFDEVGVFGYWFEIETDQGKYALQNNKDSIYWTREKGSMGPSTVERLPGNLNRVRRYRQTIYAPDFKVPDWARDIVYYYIFPERFRNGDKSNDPRPGGGRPQDRYQDRDVERHTKWNEKPFKPGTGDGSDNVYNNDFFGGDLAGIIEKLDYIKTLGANTIYMTPSVPRLKQPQVRHRRLQEHRPGLRHQRGLRALVRRGGQARHPRHARHLAEPRRRGLALLQSLRQFPCRGRLRQRQAQSRLALLRLVQVQAGREGPEQAVPGLGGRVRPAGDRQEQPVLPRLCLSRQGLGHQPLARSRRGGLAHGRGALGA